MLGNLEFRSWRGFAGGVKDCGLARASSRFIAIFTPPGVAKHRRCTSLRGKSGAEIDRRIADRFAKRRSIDAELVGHVQAEEIDEAIGELASDGAP
jgi:hypothetical protein